MTPKSLTDGTKQAFIDHIRAELESYEDEEVATQMLGYWVISLVENAHLYPKWFKDKET